MDMKLEVVVIPVSDVDRAKRFYEKLGFAWTSTTSPTRTTG
jgi:predicted enzyme related to lactoylglutathione lyase